MGRVVEDIARSDIGKFLGSDVGAILTPGLSLPATMAGITKHVEDPPPPPGIDPSLENIKNQQIDQAKNFRADLGNKKSLMSQNLRGQANEQLQSNLGAVRSKNSARGLLYGGLNQSEEGSERARSSAGLGRAIQSSNTALENAADTLDSNAIETARGVQQSQQQIQNDIYSQAMAQLNSQNAMTSNIMSTAATIGLGLLRGGR